jgi:hypothetical protein
MGLYKPGLARRGIAVVRLRGVLTGASACRLTVPLRHAFTADPQLLVTDLAGLRGWDDCGRASSPTSRRTWPPAAGRWRSARWAPTCSAPSRGWPR